MNVRPSRILLERQSGAPVVSFVPATELLPGQSSLTSGRIDCVDFAAAAPSNSVGRIYRERSRRCLSSATGDPVFRVGVAPGKPQEARMALWRTTRVGTLGVRSTSRPSTAPSSTSMVARASAGKSCLTVVSGGRK